MGYPLTKSFKEGVLLPTTTVGSFPKSEGLKTARAQFSRGEISREQLQQLEQQETESCIRMQEALDIDILVDGEMYRGDMATYFAETLKGLTISGLVRSYGNRYYRKPIVKEKIRWEGPMTVSWYQFAQKLTDRPVKGMLTGPYTLMDWSFNEYYPDRRACALAFAEAIRQEAEALQAAGAEYIQIDEPALSVRTDEIDLAVEAMGVVTKNLAAKTITHVCYGAFEKIYPKMLDMPVDQFDLEIANSNYDLLALFKKHPFKAHLALGVFDVHSHRVESQGEMEAGIRKALEVLTPEQLTIDPDCGLKTREAKETYEKLSNMVAATKKVRATLGVKERALA